MVRVVGTFILIIGLGLLAYFCKDILFGYNYH